MILFNPELSWSTKEGTHLIGFDLRLWGGLLMFFLLILEVADRVVMKRDLQIAREIQMWLLPVNPPPVPGMEIAFATRPANTVAGDYYDVFPRPASASANQSYLIAVADVAGKSIPAALLMATFQASLKTLSATPSSLPELVESMNRYACSNSQGGLRFTTAFLAEYEPATRTLTYINAGHNGRSCGIAQDRSNASMRAASRLELRPTPSTRAEPFPPVLLSDSGHPMLDSPRFATSADRANLRLLNRLNQQAGDVIVLRRVADEEVEIDHYAALAICCAACCKDSNASTRRCWKIAGGGTMGNGLAVLAMRLASWELCV